MNATDAAASLFVALGGREHNYGKLHIITQRAGDRRRFLVRMGVGSLIRDLHQQWEGYDVVYTGPGEPMPLFE